MLGNVGVVFAIGADRVSIRFFFRVVVSVKYARIVFADVRLCVDVEFLFLGWNVKF